MTRSPILCDGVVRVPPPQSVLTKKGLTNRNGWCALNAEVEMYK